MATSDVLISPPKIGDLVVTINSSSEITFDEKDKELMGPHLKAEMQRIAQKTMEQRNKTCAGRPWWSCNEATTQGACAFQNGVCKGAPLEVAPVAETHFDKWLRLYTAIYALIPRPRSLSQTHDPDFSNRGLVRPKKKSIQRHLAFSGAKQASYIV